MNSLVLSDLNQKDIDNNISVKLDYLAKQSEHITIRNDAELITANEMLGEVKSFIKKAETIRDTERKPFGDEYDRISNYFKGKIQSAEIIESNLKGSLLAYAKAVAEIERKAKAEELARLEAERLAIESAQNSLKDINPEMSHELAIEKVEKQTEIQLATATPIAEIKKVSSAAGTASTKKVWTFEITDQALIPREYLEINEKKIMAGIRFGIREIPGVRIYQDEQISFRGSR